jgi:hypothetical protein
MHIITTIFYSEVNLQQSLSSEAASADPVEVMQMVEGNFEEAGREWVSIYEGKNRMLPFDLEE